MRSNRGRRLVRLGLIAGGALLLIAALAAAASAWYNARLISSYDAMAGDRLSAIDKAHLTEALQLKHVVGSRVWPGLESDATPILIGNGTHDFLVGADSAPAGWQQVDDDDLAGADYYRRPHEVIHEKVVKVDGSPVVVAKTKAYADRLVIDELQEELPSWLAAVFPYAVLLQPTEIHLSELVHGMFHGHLAAVAPERYAEADAAFWGIGGYPLGSSKLRADTEAEIQALLDGLAAEDEPAVAASAREFLAVRERRRGDPVLDAWAQDLERRSEWLKGLAKYVELETLRLAAEDPEYRPVAGLVADESFDGYSGFPEHWEKVLGAMHRSVDQGTVMRFHYAGMAQAKLLDRLAPDWKQTALEPAVYLEDLLGVAAEPGAGALP